MCFTREEKRNLGKKSGVVEIADNPSRAIRSYAERALQYKPPYQREKQMKSLAALILSIVIVWVVWNVIGGLVGGLLHLAITIAVISLFVFAVAAVYRMLTGQKQTY